MRFYYQLFKKAAAPLVALTSTAASKAFLNYMGRHDVVPVPYGWALQLQLQQKRQQTEDRQHEVDVSSKATSLKKKQ